MWVRVSFHIDYMQNFRVGIDYNPNSAGLKIEAMKGLYLPLFDANFKIWNFPEHLSIYFPPPHTSVCSRCQCANLFFALMSRQANTVAAAEKPHSFDNLKISFLFALQSISETCSLLPSIAEPPTPASVSSAVVWPLIISEESDVTLRRPHIEVGEYFGRSSASRLDSVCSGKNRMYKNFVFIAWNFAAWLSLQFLDSFFGYLPCVWRKLAGIRCVSVDSLRILWHILLDVKGIVVYIYIFFF